MTSGTGESRWLALSRFSGRRGQRNSGFTLVEIIVVMAIVVTLFSLVAVGVSGLRGKAAERATQALLRRIQAYLDDYKEKTGSYPPDGIDSPVTNDQGTPIRGSACLYYFLAQKPVTLEEIRAGKKFVMELPPIAQIQGSEISLPNPNYPGAFEILDGWKNPLHYDNTEDGEFKPQRGEVHIPPEEDSDHPPDPRTSTFRVQGKMVVEEEGPQGLGYDVWSYGEQGHEVKELKAPPIATWSLKDE